MKNRLVLQSQSFSIWAEYLPLSDYRYHAQIGDKKYNDLSDWDVFCLCKYQDEVDNIKSFQKGKIPYINGVAVPKHWKKQFLSKDNMPLSSYFTFRKYHTTDSQN